MKYILMDYVQEKGWPQLTKGEQEHWLGAYRAYMEAMQKAGVLQDSRGLHGTAAATTVRVVNNKPQVLDGPYAETRTARRLSHHRSSGSGCRDRLGAALAHGAAWRGGSASGARGHDADQRPRRNYQRNIWRVKRVPQENSKGEISCGA